MMSVTRLRNALHTPGAIALAVLLHASATSAGTLAQDGGYELQPDVVGAGGAKMSGATWMLDGTIGPIDPIVQTAAGGLRLDGGFWHAAGVVGASDRIFRNGFD
ncbi:MAG: hypothetical protein ABJB02_10895 [Dokdonella sp.]